MSRFTTALKNLATRLGLTDQARQDTFEDGDYSSKTHGVSFVDMTCSALANLMCYGVKVPVSGGTARAEWLDSVSTDFVNSGLVPSVQTAFATGDCLVVPFMGKGKVENIVVPQGQFEVLGEFNDSATAVAYVVDEQKKGTTWYTLMQYIGLVGSECRYQLYVAVNGEITDLSPSVIPVWSGYAASWSVEGVDRLLVGRYKSIAIDPNDVNGSRGVPICSGANGPIRELHYLYEQLHTEFELSEKAIIADKALFRRQRKRFTSGGESTEESVTVLPKGRERTFVDVYGGRNVDSEPVIHDWSPSIREADYVAAIEEQKRLLEACVGVSTGILSKPDTATYENVDNVRKSQQKTMSFIDHNRRVCEAMLADLFYAWDVLGNVNAITPVGGWGVTYDWSDEYVNTFSDRQQAILSGISVGATDAVDYRMFLYDEPVNVAKERVGEIQSAMMPDVV